MLPKMFSPNTYLSSPSLVNYLNSMMSATSQQGIIGALHGMKNRADSTTLLPSIHIPTLIIHGAEDQLIPLSVANEMQAAIPGSILSVIPHAGHLLNLDQPHLFNQAVESFLLPIFYA